VVSDEIQKVQSIVGTSPGRPKLDFYRTPEEAVIALLNVESFDGIVWEPACGDGAISSVLKDYGVDVISSDIHDYGYGPVVDFLTTNETVDHIVTNPPFFIAQKFVERALASTTGKVAMLLKLAFLEGKKRKAFFEQNPPKKVWVFSNRITMHREGNEEAYKNGGMIAFAWFIWEHGHTGPTEIGWL
jgi:hypothetical protein